MFFIDTLLLFHIKTYFLVVIETYSLFQLSCKSGIHPSLQTIPVTFGFLQQSVSPAGCPHPTLHKSAFHDAIALPYGWSPGFTVIVEFLSQLIMRCLFP